MNHNVIIGNEHSFLPGAKAFVTGGKTEADSTKTKLVLPYDSTSYAWSPWGDDNLFPQNVLSDLESNSITLRALEKRKAIHFGRGIIAYREDEPGEDGLPKKIKVTDAEVVEFFRVNRVNFQWVDLIGSLETFANGWIEFITNKAKDKINKLYIKDPAYCRLEKMDPVTARIKNLYYSAQWDRYVTAEQEKVCVTVPMFDPSKIMDGKYQDGNFIYPVFYRSFNKSYYHLAVWNGIRTSGWLDIANKVPLLKKAIMKNQMTIKYHIRIPDDYFQHRYPSPNFTKEYRETKKKEVLQDMNDFLTDVENSGKAFISFSFYNKVKQDYLSGWQIDVIDNKLKDDAYLPDSQAANSEILFALGVDPTLIGSGMPGGKLGAGSGSDKREAFWQLNAEMGIYRQISLEPLYFIRDFNRWDPAIQFDYVTVDTAQTQDKNPTKTEKRIDQNAE